VKEQTARMGATVLDRSLPATLQRFAVPALFVALALLVTTGYGSGVQLNDGQASLHINPLKFLGQLLHAWNPQVGLGTHTGYWFPYQMPYAWFYGIAQLLHIPQLIAQHTAVFLVYLACLWSMYYCLRVLAPWLDEVARIAGSCAYLFNMYVALNSQAQIVWLLTYATLPAMVGVTARAMRGEINIWRATLAIALLFFVGGGVNPPLVAINVVILAIFVIVTIAFDPKPGETARRTMPIIIAASVAAIAINLYWIVPFADFFRGVWLAGVLSEPPAMHNAATSFVNVLRGLGHWATFVSFAGRAYFPWAADYAAGLFGALLWFVPIVALGGVAYKRNQRPVTLFFLIVTIISVPIVVGYYHDALGNAVTTPIYDQFYRNFPGFQMFRFSYKWVAGVEFGISGLYALAVYALTSALREHLADSASEERWAWTISAARMLFIGLPILIFVPVLTNKMNYPGQPIPAWEFRESALVGDDQNQRVAVFPTQFLEQFDWGAPQFYIEDSLVDRPMIYGLLGSLPSEGSDVWVRRAYRATREGLPFSADMLRVMGVDTILQRDDFTPTLDFSSPGEWRYNSTTLTHDLIHRVIKASPVRSDGPLRVYHLSGALPLLYGVAHPVISTLPAFTDGYLGDIGAMAKGRAQFDPPTRSADEFTDAMKALSPVLPGSAEQIRDLAVNQALPGGIRVQPSSADASWLTPFQVRSSGTYAVFAMDQGMLFGRTPPQTLEIDGQNLALRALGGAWTQYSNVNLTAGAHWVSDGYVDPDLVVAIVNVDDLRAWLRRIAALTHALPRNLATTELVYAPRTVVTVRTPGTYGVSATAVGSFGPDGLVRTGLRRGATFRGAFPADLSATLPYIFGTGVVGTMPIMMPPQWYREDPTAYQWQRGDPIPWFLFARNAQVRVFVPGHDGVRARVSMRLSRLQVTQQLTVAVKGGATQDVVLPQPRAGDQQYDTVDRLQGPTPAPLGFTLDLRPGWNDVTFAFHSLNGERSDLGPNVISAAVAPDLAFTRIGALRAPAAPKSDPAFTAAALANPPFALAGDPEVTGSAANTPSRGAWLAVALAHHGNVVYRIYPITKDGSFDVDFMHAFPDDWSDESQQVVGLWFVARGNRPRFSNIYYNVHALPARAFHRPQSLIAPPLRIDGHLIGKGPVFLSRGRHVVASADPQVTIGTLSLQPLSLPPTRDLGLDWTQRSSTAIDVAAPRTASPFLLVFGEAYHPEWRATLDGQVLPHVVVDGVDNGWIVPSLPDGGSIVLTFAGESYYIVAAAISVIALLIIIVLAWAPELWPIQTRNR
jgi:hypothetical protein